MRRLAPVGLVLGTAAAFAGAAWAKIAPMPLEEQYQQAGHVVRARLHAAHPVEIAEHVAYALWEFEVLETFKGGVLPLNAPDRPNRVIVVGQSEHAIDCALAPSFRTGGEYLLFLRETGSSHLYGLVTDRHGHFEATAERVRWVKARAAAAK